jgi:hypothetical protein
LPQDLAPGAVCECTFPGDFTGMPGDFQVDLVGVAGVDDDGRPVFGGARAEVIIVDVPSAIQVIKTATLTEIPETGGDVTFEVTIANLSQVDEVTIDTLVDTPTAISTARETAVCPRHRRQPYRRAAGRPTAIAIPAASPQTLTGATAGDVLPDTVTASGPDDDNQPVLASDSAVVTVVATPAPVAVEAIRVTKVVSPTTVVELGGEVAYAVLIENLSAVPVRVTDLDDDLYGDLSDPANPLVKASAGCGTGVDIAAGGGQLCLFRADATGDASDLVLDTVSVKACVLVDSACSGDELSDADDTTVSIITRGPSTIEVIKTANPTNVTEPGASVTFTVEVVNTSVSAEITIDSLVDDVYGDLNGQGNCVVPQPLGAGETYSCAFTADVTGSNGDRVTNAVVASGLGDADPPKRVSAQDDARVSGTGSPPSLDVTKTPSPTVVLVPGDEVTFSVTVENTSAAATLDIITLSDDVYGDLNGLGDCAVPQTLAPGGTYSCSFPGDVVGEPARRAGEHRHRVRQHGRQPLRHRKGARRGADPRTGRWGRCGCCWRRSCCS